MKVLNISWALKVHRTQFHVLFGPFIHLSFVQSFTHSSEADGKFLPIKKTVATFLGGSAKDAASEAPFGLPGGVTHFFFCISILLASYRHTTNSVFVLCVIL